MLTASLRMLAVLLAAARAAAAPVPRDASLTTERFPSAWAAVEATLAEARPSVIGFGEWHQTHETVHIPSTLRRFTEQILPHLAPQLSHLILETWMTSGKCGAAEVAVTEGLARTIERPAATGGEIEAALRGAQARGVAPRILTMTCDDYRSMRGDGSSAVDYDRTLRLTGRALGYAISAAQRQRARETPSLSAARPWLAAYGGAVHNDVYPMAELAAYSYAPDIALSSLGRFLEIDLVVPEYAAAAPLMRAQDWWPVYLRARRATTAVRIRRGPRSFIIVFPVTAATHSRPAVRSTSPRRAHRPRR